MITPYKQALNSSRKASLISWHKDEQWKSIKNTYHSNGH